MYVCVWGGAGVAAPNQVKATTLTVRATATIPTIWQETQQLHCETPPHLSVHLALARGVLREGVAVGAVRLADLQHVCGGERV